MIKQRSKCDMKYDKRQLSSIPIQSNCTYLIIHTYIRTYIHTNIHTYEHTYCIQRCIQRCKARQFINTGNTEQTNKQRSIQVEKDTYLINFFFDDCFDCSTQIMYISTKEINMFLHIWSCGL